MKELRSSKGRWLDDYYGAEGDGDGDGGLDETLDEQNDEDLGLLIRAAMMDVEALGVDREGDVPPAGKRCWTRR